MAIWQFKMEVVPAERVQGRDQIEEADMDAGSWWAERQPPTDFRQRLAALLPPTTSWNKKLLWYGEEDGDRFDVWIEHDRVESFAVRLDCRKANPLLVDGLLRLANDWSCSFIELRYLKVLPSTPSEFVRAIVDSPSCRFMENPAYWLPKLAAEVKARESGK